jgi:hypothetical protein
MKTTMRKMVDRKLSRTPAVEDFKRALRHAAHTYDHCNDAGGLIGEMAGRREDAAEALYRAARALVAAELLEMNVKENG